jgi:hypothetical protein
MFHQSKYSGPSLFATTLFGGILLSVAFQASAAKAADSCGLSISAKFIEGAPTDRFEIYNISGAEWTITRIAVDLSQAPAGLIFDIQEGGGGLEVFQPFRTASLSDLRPASLASFEGLEDGGQLLELKFSQFGKDETFAFTIDLDDSLENSERRQTQVVGNEIEGALLEIEAVNNSGKTARTTATFNASAQAKTEATCS